MGVGAAGRRRERYETIPTFLRQRASFRGGARNLIMDTAHRVCVCMDRLPHPVLRDSYGWWA